MTIDKLMKNNRWIALVILAIVLIANNPIGAQTLLEEPFIYNTTRPFLSPQTEQLQPENPSEGVLWNSLTALHPSCIANDSLQLALQTYFQIHQRNAAINPLYGSKFMQTGIVAYGSTNLTARSWGKIAGAISYNRGRNGAVGYNNIRQPEVYFPYVVADSMGGVYHYEQYSASGMFAKQWGRHELTASVHYQGEMAYRFEDPRASNTVGTLQPGLGYSIHLNRFHLLQQIQYLYARQYLDLWLWRPQQQDKFYLHYGMGYVDIKNSPIFFGTQRMNYIHGVEYLLALNKPYASPLYVTNAVLRYRYYKMQTEEPRALGLFVLRHHAIDLFVEQKLNPFTIVGQFHLGNRVGQENIYADVRPEEKYSTVYDRNVIARYRFWQVWEPLAQIELNYHKIGLNANLFSLGLGSVFHNRKQLYTRNAQQISLTIVKPWIAFAWSNPNKANVVLSVGYRLPVASVYQVSKGGKDRLDYQLAWLPYQAEMFQGASVKASTTIPFTIAKQHFVTSVNIAWQQVSRSALLTLYDGSPSTVSSIFSNPNVLLLRGNVLGGEVSVTYHFF